MFAESTLKDAVLQALDDLPQERMAEVLNFALFLKTRPERSCGRGSRASLALRSCITVKAVGRLGGLGWGCCGRLRKVI